MSVKDVKRYYDEVANQYVEMRKELKDFTELAEKSMFEPERLDLIKETIRPLMRNYEMLSYVMYLLNMPTKKQKKKKYEKMNGSLLKSISDKNTKNGVVSENVGVIDQLRNQKVTH